MASTKATELAQLSRKLTYNEATNEASIPTGTFLTTGDNTDDLQEGLTNLYHTDARSRAAISALSPISYNSTTGEISLDSTSTDGEVDTLTLSTLNFGTDAALSWNDTDGTVDIAYGGVTLQIGQEQHYYGKATEAIADGDVVMFAGSQGSHVLFAKADVTATGFIPEWIMGVATQSFALNDFGYVTSFGKVRGFDTSGYSAGDLLYLDPATPGGFVTTEPAYPNHSILIAATLDSTNNGTILVRPSHKEAIEELQDVSVSSVTTGDILAWNGTVWANTSDYYTVADADSAIATAISNLVDSAPGTLDTLNELAAALGDDPNFATTVTTALTDRISRANDTTDDLTEGTTNLYYTDGRVTTLINNTNIDADTVDGKHYDDIISEATALAIALG